MNKRKIVFITYGDNNFRLQKKHLLTLAKKSGYFDTCLAYSPKELNNNFLNKYEEILKNKKGAGFWIWKHQIIKQQLEKVNDGDIVVYSDAGSSLNLNAGNKFDEYIDILSHSKYSTLRFKNDQIEKYWTSKEIFNYFGLYPESTEGNSQQYLAGHIIVKKSESLREQLNEVDKLLDKDMYLITDKYSGNQIEGYRSNRHDQSILSILSKIYGCEEKENEVWFKQKEKLQFEYPFLAVQQGAYTNWQKIKFYSLYPKHIQST
ncbi:hypothetical protein OAY26_03640, partial [Acidimicrobiia bacterium]|nr:hypothetical protein [Acidimicrobiia bacterium]